MTDCQDFLDYLRFERRVSAHTVSAYGEDLAQFFDFMQQILSITSLPEIKPADIRTWIITMLEDDQYSARTVNRKISSVRAFYRYALKMKQIDQNPLTRIHAPKYHARLPQYVEMDDMKRLFSDDLFASDFEGFRDRTVIEMFYATGMRLSELINIKRQDIDLYNDTVKVLGKRNKERIIPFGRNMRMILTRYIELFEEKYLPDNENYYIFVAANGNRIYPKAIYRIVRKYLDKVTAIDKRSPHVIRHTFATHMLNNGADLNAIKEILGHSNLAATQVYTHNSIEQLKSIYKQAHPRA